MALTLDALIFYGVIVFVFLSLMAMGWAVRREARREEGGPQE